MTEQSTGSQVDVRRALRILWRRKLIALATILVLPALVYFVSDSQPRVYTSSALMQISAPPDVAQLLTAAAVTPSPDSTQATARLVSTTAVADDAAAALGLPRSAGRSLLSQITVTGDEIGGFLTVTSTDGDAQQAAKIANTFAETIVGRRSRSTTRRFVKAIDQLTAELAIAPKADPVGRKQLSQNIQRLRALRAAQGANAQIIEPAVASTTPISPKPRRTTALAIVVAFLIAIGLVLLAENIDRRIRQTLELEELTGLPLLAVLPQGAFGASLDAHQHQHQYQMLRAGLTYFNIDRTLSSLMVTSAMQGEGKTTVASNLAYAFARSGRHVIVVDADLRRPRVHDAFGLSNRAGLGAAIVQARSLDEVLTTIELTGATEGGSLRVLSAGPTPPNSSELLASGRMREIMSELKDRADLVLIDTSPMVLVSDALPLVEQVGGVVVVARLNHTTRDATARLQQLLQAAQARVFGVVATGVKHNDGYGYGYGEADGAGGKQGFFSRFRRRPKSKNDDAPAASTEETREPVKISD